MKCVRLSYKTDEIFDGHFVDDHLLICSIVPNFDSLGIDPINFKF